MILRNMTDEYELMMVLYKNEEILNCVKDYIDMKARRLMDFACEDWSEVVTIEEYDIAQETCYVEVHSIENYEEFFREMSEEIFIPEMNYVGLMGYYKEYKDLNEEDDSFMAIDIKDSFAHFVTEGFKKYFHRLKSSHFVFQEFCSLLEKIRHDEYEPYEESYVMKLEKYFGIQIDDDYTIKTEKMILMKELEEMKAKVQQLEQKIASL